MEIANLVISLISGAVGGNIAGAAASDKSLGTLGNSIVGLVGGGIGGYILQALDIFQKAGAGGAVPGLDLTSVLGDVGVGGVAGAVLTFIIGYLKNSMQKSS